MLTIRFDSRAIVLTGTVLVIAGAFLPWVNLPDFLVSEGARWALVGGSFLTSALGMLGMLSVLLPWQFWRRTALPAVLLTLPVSGIAMLALTGIVWQLYNLSPRPGAFLSGIGSGLYLTCIGALVALVGGLWPAARRGAAPPRAIVLILASLSGLCILACVCAALTGALAVPLSAALQARTPPPTAAPTLEPLPMGLLATPLVDIKIMTWPAAPTSTVLPAAPPLPIATPRPLPIPPPAPAPTSTPATSTLQSVSPIATPPFK